MGWVFVNVLIPVALPMLLLSVFKLVHLPSPYAQRVELKTLLQNGQLSWVTMCLAAAAMHELFVVMMDVDQRPSVWAGVFLSMATMLLLFSCVIAVAATLFPLDRVRKDARQSQVNQLRYNWLFGVSVITFCMTGTLYSVVHFN